MNQSKIAVLIFVVAGAFILLSQCKRDKPNNFMDTKSYHDFVNFKKLSRVEQVKACGKCHQQIYENEMQGPHATAYKNILSHTEFINSKQYDCAPYCSYVNEALPRCIKCHTGANLFETVFKNDPPEEEIIKGINANKNYIAMLRDSSTLITGVDCITCHYNGHNVVTTTDFVKTAGKTDCPDYCNPQKSALFTSNISCYPCHLGQVVSMAGYPTKPASCNSCHEEKDAKGKMTHYTYWAHNPAGREIPPHLNLFEGIEVEYLKSRGGVKILWNNKILPHMRSVCTELVAVIEVTKNKKYLCSDTIRINQKVKLDSELSTWFKDTPVPGRAGTEFKSLNDSIVDFIALPEGAQKGDLEINITGYKKEQYWLSDSIRTVYLHKTIPLHL